MAQPKLKVPFQQAAALQLEAVSFTTSGRFETYGMPDSLPFIHFLDAFVGYWNSMYRWAFARKIRNPKMGAGQLKAMIVKHWHVKARIANSVINDVRGTIQAAIELKKEQIKSHKQKAEAISQEILELEKLKGQLWASENWNRPSKGAVQCLRNLRKRIVSLKKKKDRYLQKTARMEQQIKTKHLPYCFGSASLLKQRWNAGKPGSPYKTLQEWRAKWESCRSRRIYFVGSSDEICGCGLFQLRYAGHDYFNIRMMSPFAKDAPVCAGRGYLEACIRIPYQTELLHKTLHKGSVSHMLVRRDKGWYLQPSLTLPVQTEKRFIPEAGCLGLDINAGFISEADTAANGQFIRAEDHLFAGYGSPREAVKQIIAHIFNKARASGKAAAIEDISLTRKKNDTVAKKKKDYNRMLSEFPYKAYREICERASVRYGVKLYIADPAYSSVLGKEKYMETLNISAHQVAAYVIARRGLGFQEFKVSKKKKKAVKKSA